MKDPFKHVEQPYPLGPLEKEEPEKEKGEERRAPFHPTFLKMIGSWEENPNQS